MSNMVYHSRLKRALFGAVLSLLLESRTSTASDTVTMFGGQETNYQITNGVFAVADAAQEIAVGGSLEIANQYPEAFLYVTSMTRNEIRWNFLFHEFTKVEALAFNQHQGSKMVYGIGRDLLSSENPFKMFSVNNRDPFKTDTVQMYRVMIEDSTLIGFYSSDSIENDFFFVTKDSINYL